MTAERGQMNKMNLRFAIVLIGLVFFATGCASLNSLNYQIKKVDEWMLENLW